MPFFKSGGFAEYMGNRMGKMAGATNMKGNAMKKPMGRGRKSVGMGNPMKSPGRRGSR